MKRFQFRLARVQRAREISESLARAEWQSKERGAIEAEAASDLLRTRIDEARAELSKLQQSPTLNPGDVLASDRALVRAWKALARKRQLASEHRDAAEASREAWSERERDRRALERLEERQRELFRIERNRADDAEADEWNSSKRRIKKWEK